MQFTSLPSVPHFALAVPRLVACRSLALVALALAGCDAGSESVTDDAGDTPRDAADSAPAVRSIPATPNTIWNRAPDPSSVASGPAPTRQLLPMSGPPVTGSDTSTLVLYDTGGAYGYLGELYAVNIANLASHFGSWTAIPVRTYACGQMAGYTATIYVGSSFDEPLPPCFLDEVLSSTRPVMWVDFNIWQLERHIGAAEFELHYGFGVAGLDTTSSCSSVTYHGRTLTRFSDNPGILSIEITDRARATELATAVHGDGTSAPWAVRSGSLTLVSEIPFSFMSEEDRILAFEDMLFDLYEPAVPERHRALLRLEDIDPMNEPGELHAIADYLWSIGVPFGFGVVTQHRDPLGVYNIGIPQTTGFRDAPALVEALHYMEAHGGTMVMHGWTHQWDGGLNPYNEVSGDDTEFFRIVQNPDETFSYVGPLPEDSIPWASSRILSAGDDYRNAGFVVPTIFEFPHYAASANSYAAVAALMSSRWERGTYYSGVLGGGAIDHTRASGQLFPFVVRDVYGSIVLPENLGNIDLVVWHGLPARSPDDIIRAADRNLVIRDGVASFFFHPFLPIEYLEQTVEGIRALGYTFVSPSSL